MDVPQVLGLDIRASALVVLHGELTEPTVPPSLVAAICFRQRKATKLLGRSAFSIRVPGRLAGNLVLDPKLHSFFPCIYLGHVHFLPTLIVPRPPQSLAGAWEGWE